MSSITSARCHPNRTPFLYIWIFMYVKNTALQHAAQPIPSHPSAACVWMHHYSPAIDHHRIRARYSFPISRRIVGWVGLDDWLHTEVVCLPKDVPIPVLTGSDVECLCWCTHTLLLSGVLSGLFFHFSSDIMEENFWNELLLYQPEW